MLPRSKVFTMMEEKIKTLINEKKGDSYHKKSIMEEHITLMSEPGSNYLGHVSVSQGTYLNALQKQFGTFLKIKIVLLIPFKQLVVMGQLLILEQK